MKSCYVLNCDKSCNSDPRRSMFTCPKNQDVFDRWVALIPFNRRPMTKSDRICERHFNAEDIEKSWQHMIQGKLVEMPRNRAQLKKDAIPCLNLDIVLDRRTSKKLRKRRSEENQPTIPTIVASDEEFLRNGSAVECLKPDPPQISPRSLQIVAQKKTAFALVFEEIFDITLPSQLWGVHRAPDETLLAFSRFCPKKLDVDLVISVDESWNYEVKHSQKPEAQGELHKMTNENLANLIEMYDLKYPTDS